MATPLGFLTGLCVVCAWPTSSHGEHPTLLRPQEKEEPSLQKWIEKAEHFLSGITSLQADFVQVVHTQAGGIESRKGKLKWKRPAHIRFDYEGLPLLQIASDGESFRQKDENGVSFSIAIDHTPAAILLQKNINFKRDTIIKEVVEEGKNVHITLTQKDNTSGGTLMLVFSKSPFVLTQWMTKDINGTITDVVLLNTTLNTKMHEKDFKL